MPLITDTTQSKPKLLIFISGNGSNLQSLINRIQSKHLYATIIGVVSDQANAFGLERAKAADLPVFSLTAAKGICREHYDQQLIHLLKQHTLMAADWLILAGFMRILSPLFIETFADKIINIHPSLLPKYKGLRTHSRVLQHNETQHGCSVHKVIPELDEGPILSQAYMAIEPTSTEEQLKAQIHTLEHQLYPLTLAALFNHTQYDLTQKEWVPLEPNQAFRIQPLSRTELMEVYNHWLPYPEQSSS